MIGERYIRKQYKEDGTQIEIVITCPLCGKDQKPFDIYPGDWDAWRSGTFVQDAFPYLTVSDRELLISGVCDSCWDDTVRRA